MPTKLGRNCIRKCSLNLRKKKNNALDESLTIKKGVRLQYNILDDYVKNAKIETTVKSIWNDINRFVCGVAEPNECGKPTLSHQ